MSVKSIGEYKFPPRDPSDSFDGMMLMFVSWDHHLLFAAPYIFYVSPDENFGEFVEQKLKPVMAPDPDAASVEWDKVTWLKANQAFQPDFAKSLTENGISHKVELRMQTGPSTLVAQGE